MSSNNLCEMPLFFLTKPVITRCLFYCRSWTITLNEYTKSWRIFTYNSTRCRRNTRYIENEFILRSLDFHFMTHFSIVVSATAYTLFLCRLAISFRVFPSFPKSTKPFTYHVCFKIRVVKFSLFSICLNPLYPQSSFLPVNMFPSRMVWFFVKNHVSLVLWLITKYFFKDITNAFSFQLLSFPKSSYFCSHRK